MIHDLTDEKKNYKIGMICALASMIIWGFLPIYWRALLPIDSYVLILYRIVLSGITCGIIVLCTYGVEALKEPWKDKKMMAKMFISGLLISINWSTYVYAVNSGQTIEASIGYFINPLVVCVFGVIFFKDRLTTFKAVSIAFMTIGVIVMIFHFMRLPIIALTLAFSFATYASIKKHLKIKAIVSLFYETMFIAIAAFPIIIYLEATNQGALHIASQYQLILLLFSGVLSATPLIFFSMAANRISLVSLGIMGYIAPSISLLIGIFIFREPFDFVQLIACLIIWIGLASFTCGEIKNANRL